MIACWPKFKFALILIVILFIQLQMDFDQTQAIYDYEEEEEEQVKQVKTHAKKKEVNLKNTSFIIQDRMMHEWRSEWMNEAMNDHECINTDWLTEWMYELYFDVIREISRAWACGDVYKTKMGQCRPPTPRPPVPSEEMEFFMTGNSWRVEIFFMVRVKKHLEFDSLGENPLDWTFWTLFRGKLILGYSWNIHTILWTASLFHPPPCLGLSHRALGIP